MAEGATTRAPAESTELAFNTARNGESRFTIAVGAQSQSGTYIGLMRDPVVRRDNPLSIGKKAGNSRARRKRQALAAGAARPLEIPFTVPEKVILSGARFN